MLCIPVLCTFGGMMMYYEKRIWEDNSVPYGKRTSILDL